MQLSYQELINNISKSNTYTRYDSLRNRLREEAYENMLDQHKACDYYNMLKQHAREDNRTVCKLSEYRVAYYNNKKLTIYTKTPKYCTYKKAFGYTVSQYYKRLERRIRIENELAERRYQ